MSNAWDTIRVAIEEAEQIDRATEHYASRLASLLRGKLRHASYSDLCALKRELAHYNMHTGRWDK